jgi:hypothetical protein
VAVIALLPGLPGVIVTLDGLGAVGHVTVPVQLVVRLYVMGLVLLPEALTVKPSDCDPLGAIVALPVLADVVTASESGITWIWPVELLDDPVATSDT